MEDVLAMLSAYLTAPPRRIDKAPDGFDAQLKRTCEATTSDIRVLLLEAGFQAWYAYLIANPETRKAVDALPSPQLQEVAHEICKTELHKDMNEHFQHVFYGSDRADHRSRLLQANGFTVPGRDPAETGPYGRKRRRITPARPSLDSASSMRPTNLHPAGIVPVMRPSFQSSGGPGINISPAACAAPVPVPVPIPFQELTPVEQQQTQPVESPQWATSTRRDSAPVDHLLPRSILPHAKHLPLVFPHYMCRSIIKSDTRAEVEVLTFDKLKQQSALKLTIYPSRVPYLAKELFGVDMDLEDGQMCLRFDSGASARIEALKLTGAQHSALEKCLGREVATAIQLSDAYSGELARGEISTDCVSLTIQRNPARDISCFLTLAPEAKSLSRIVSWLWPSV